MQKAYTLRADLEGSFSGGTVMAGTEGNALELSQALSDGGGEILTDDQVLQVSLESLMDGKGRVFSVYLVNEENGERTEVTPQDTAVSPGFIPKPTAESVGQAQTPTEDTEGVELNPQAPGAAVHAPDSGYGALHVNELREIAEQRGLELSHRATKETIVEMLNAADVEEQERASNDS